jgi:hypothetical protein
MKWLGPSDVELTVAEVSPHAALNLGVLRRAFTHYFKAPGFSIEIVREEPPGATYRLRWTP